jgi:uncharacterized damage-inducible protein DinB
MQTGQPQDPTLATIYENWKHYQDLLAQAIAPLTDEQLALRAAPNLRSIGENAAHIISCRAGWFHHVLGEGGEEIVAFDPWDARDAPARGADELVHGLEATWQFMADRFARWTPADMQQTFPDEGPDGVTYEVSRAWVIWHLIEHDLHHGGEISLTLGMHGLQAIDI